MKCKKERTLNCCGVKDGEGQVNYECYLPKGQLSQHKFEIMMYDGQLLVMQKAGEESQLSAPAFIVSCFQKKYLGFDIFFDDLGQNFSSTSAAIP